MNSKHVLLAIAALAFTSASTVFANDMAAAPSESEIAQIMKTADNAEIEMATLALKNAQSREVKAFARHMVTEHTKHKAERAIVDVKTDVSPAANPTAATLKKDSDAKLAELKNLKGNDFDKAYIQTQTNMHRQLASDIESKFIPAAKDQKFKSFLQETEKAVREHLQQAENLQTAMK